MSDPVEDFPGGSGAEYLLSQVVNDAQLLQPFLRDGVAAPPEKSHGSQDYQEGPQRAQLEQPIPVEADHVPHAGD